MYRLSFHTLAATVLLMLALGLASAQVTGKISEVTVYRGQALVTREVDFPATAGPQEVVIAPLPAQIIPESLYAVGGPNLTIRAVRFRQSVIGREPRDEVRKLDEQIEIKRKELQRIASQVGVLDGKSRFLDKLENFTSGTATAELSKGVLDPKALTDTAEYLFKQREEIAVKRLALDTEREGLEKEKSLFEGQRRMLVDASSKTQREALIFLDAAYAHAAHLTLSYMVQHVDWTPAYTARLNDKHDAMTLEYHAVVSQMSGEDWSDVKLTLATTRPNMIADAPMLSPLWVGVAQAGPAGTPPGRNGYAGDYLNQRNELKGQLRGQQGDGNGYQTFNNSNARQPNMPTQQAFGMNDPNDAIGQNIVAGRLQSLELAADDETVRSARKVSGQEDTGGLAVAYALPGKISLQSRSDQQMFRIANLGLKADFYYTAVPLLSDYIYQGVDAINNSDYPLLPGPVNAYLDGSFAGQGVLPLVAIGQGLTIGFGTETQLRVSRELVDKTTDIRAGNQLITYNYRLRLQNYMARPVKVRVWDRIPQAPETSVTINLPKVEPALSVDDAYLADERPRGLLRWDIDIPANANGTKALNVKYQLQLELDKTFRIGEMPSTLVEKMKQDFEMLRNQKMMAK